MRELTSEEIKVVSGGFNPVSVLGAISLGWQIGWNTGKAINDYNSAGGRSFGSSLYWIYHN